MAVNDLASRQLLGLTWSASTNLLSQIFSVIELINLVDHIRNNLKFTIHQGRKFHSNWFYQMHCCRLFGNGLQTKFSELLY